MLFSDEACEIISTFACCAATTSKVLAAIPGIPRSPVPLIATRMTPRIDVTALTPHAEGCPSTVTRVPDVCGLKLLRIRTGMPPNTGRIVLWCSTLAP